MNPRRFFDVAGDLAASADPTPAELRTAISRAYYAAYHVAVGLLGRMGVRLPGGWEAHKLVGEALRNSADIKIAAASRDLDENRKFRWAADYDLGDSSVENQRFGQKIVARAKRIAKEIDACEADSARFIEVRIRIRNWAGSAEGAGKDFLLI
jgi:uncharacterized protein (UPF0332 family)